MLTHTETRLPSMLTREAPSPFVIVGDTPNGELAVPTTSARAAAQAARHLSEHCPHTRATWQVNPHAGPGPVVVFGCARPPTGQHLLNQDSHAFPLAPGQALPPVWVALCGHQIGHAEFEALDPGTSRPCQSCHQQCRTSSPNWGRVPQIFGLVISPLVPELDNRAAPRRPSSTVEFGGLRAPKIVQ